MRFHNDLYYENSSFLKGELFSLTHTTFILTCPSNDHVSVNWFIHSIQNRKSHLYQSKTT